jgi:hypothetical protein
MAGKLSQMMCPTLVLGIGNCRTPLLVGLDPEWIPLRECAPLSVEKCVLVIPPSESDEMCLKMTALLYWEMGRKGFPESDLMLLSGTPNVSAKCFARPSLENSPQLIPPSKSDAELGKRCALPSSQMGRREISEFSLEGTSRIPKPPQELHPHPG